MSKLPAITGRQAIAAFEQLGFSVDRITDSHHIMKKAGHRYNISIPIHGAKPLKAGTLRTLVRNAGVDVEAFVNAIRD